MDSSHSGAKIGNKNEKCKFWSKKKEGDTPSFKFIDTAFRTFPSGLRDHGVGSPDHSNDNNPRDSQ